MENPVGFGKQARTGTRSTSLLAQATAISFASLQFSHCRDAGLRSVAAGLVKVRAIVANGVGRNTQ